MPIPRHSNELHSFQLPPPEGCDGVTELRVHGVGGASPRRYSATWRPSRCGKTGRLASTGPLITGPPRVTRTTLAVTWRPAALVQEGRRPAKARVGLVTLGSPAVRLYEWAFPAYFPVSLWESMAATGSAPLASWRNFYYPTDPVASAMGDGLASAGGKGRGARRR